MQSVYVDPAKKNNVLIKEWEGGKHCDRGEGRGGIFEHLNVLQRF